MDAGPIQLVDARDPDWLALHSQRRHAVGPASGRSLAVPQPSRARPFIAARSILSLTRVRAVPIQIVTKRLRLVVVKLNS